MVVVAVLASLLASAPAWARAGATAAATPSMTVSGPAPFEDGLPLSSSRVIRPLHAREVPFQPIPHFVSPAIDGGARRPFPRPTPDLGQLDAPRHLRQSGTGPSIGGSFPGLSNPGLIDPADVQVAAGPTDVVEMVNSNVEVWGTDGVFEKSESLGSFFSDTSSNRSGDEMTDPRVLYDAQSSHWFSTVLDVTASEVIMVVSPSAVPGGGAWVYTFPSSGCQDQPRLGISDTLVAYGADVFPAGCQGSLIGGELVLLDKGNLLSGATVDQDVYGPSAYYSELTPVESMSSTGTLYIAATDQLSGAAVDLFSTSVVHAGTLPATPIAVASFGPPPSAPETDPNVIDTGDARVQNAVWDNGNLWLAFSDGCYATGSTTLQSCGRFEEIATSTMQLLSDTNLVLSDGVDVFYPAVMPASDGNVFTVFGYSSSSDPPGVGVLENPQVEPSTWSSLTAGTGPNDSGRWGDYFGIARDPVNPARVWVAGQLGAGGNAWGTTVAAIADQPFSISDGTHTKPPAACVVPRVVGKRLASAKRALVARHCRVGRIRRAPSRAPKGWVIKQVPKPRAHLQAGARVAVTVSRGKKA